MTAEQELLRRLREALAAADLEVEDLIGEAWSEARDEVRDVLRRLMTQDLLRRATTAFEGADRQPTRGSPGYAAPPSSEPEDRPGSSGRTDEPAAAVDEPGAAATYLFGVAGSDIVVPADLPHLPGGGGVRTVVGGTLSAVVCDVDPAVFERLNEPGPETIELLAEAATAHDAVLAALAEEGPVLPLRLGTVVADDGVVEDLLVRNAAQLRAELERITGYAEWAVTVHVLAGADDPETGQARAAASGRDYLEQRRVALDARENRSELREELAASIHEELATHASGSRRVESRPLEEDTAPLLHGVYLVAHGSFPDFQATVEELRSRYRPAIIEVSGPWPPYHFTSVDLSGEPPTS